MLEYKKQFIGGIFMKPLNTANSSFWSTIALLILFNLPYVGTPALIICLLFCSSTHAGKVDRIFLIVCLILGVILGVLSVILGFSIDSLFPGYEFPLTQEEELEAFRSILNIA